MPSYKITYFPARGRAEVARQILTLAGVPFEDNRLPMDQWPAYKEKTPFGQMPVLEVDGKEIPQSYAIFRYLAKEHGFAGVSAYQRALVDALADQHKDYTGEIASAMVVFMGFAPGDKDALVKDVAEPARDKYFSILEKIAKGNEKNGFFIGASLTWVDLLIADFVGTITSFIPGHLDAFPSVLATVAKINATPKLKEWIASRPASHF
ncbi:hypothetical protein PRIPAC_85046 [Pristionchus pacificus]|uniref:glutathione transferase n=1 Tax=Pristionchus pacificus TaxID=54126 RepID=A0A454XL72_PRIPA|nr:hypothetical protein PRIPAC_85046 [Pristionchus pacificus]|eukprot:PDM66510.1 gst-6 [Pristionchus pacificus]